MVSDRADSVPRGPSLGALRFHAPASVGQPAPVSRKGGKEATRPAGPPRLLFVNQYYWPDHASTAQHLTDLAESLAARGYECHVVCSQGSYKPGQRRRKKTETRHGVHIHRVPATSLGRRSTLRRLVDYISFYANAALLCLLLGRFDAAITLTTPPIIGLIGTLLRLIHGTRHIYWSMDLHPDASLALGRVSRSNLVVGLLARLSDVVYRRADRVVALGPYMADLLSAKGVRPARIVEIPVWSRADEIYPLPRVDHPLREQFGLADKFVAMYSGNLGLAHSSEEFLDAARQLRDRSDIVFLFVGGGPRIGEIERAKEREKLENIRLLDYFPREQLFASLSLADVHLVSMRPEMAGIVVPGKLYGAMASARPVLFVGPDHCETADTIREHDCGRTVRRGDATALVAALEELAGDADLCVDLGTRAREAFLQHYERASCCEAWGRLVAEIAGLPPASALPRAISPPSLACAKLRS